MSEEKLAIPTEIVSDPDLMETVQLFLIYCLVEEVLYVLKMCFPKCSICVLQLYFCICMLVK